MSAVATEPPHFTTMKVLGGWLLTFSIIQVAIGTSTFQMLSPHHGSWWGGIASVVAGVLGYLSFDKCVVIMGCVCAIVAIVVALIALIVDASYATIIDELQVCMDTGTGNYYGDNAKHIKAFNCAYGSLSPGETPSQCVCAVDHNTCMSFKLRRGNCGVLLTTYPDFLIVSVVLLAIIVLLSFIYSIVTCRSYCSSNPSSSTVLPGNSPQSTTVVVSIGHAMTPHQEYAATTVSPGHGQPVHGQAKPQVQYASNGRW